MTTSELEALRKKIIQEHTQGINTRQLILKMWLEKNYDKKEEKQVETVIKVEGMMCPHCKARVESVCKGIAGVKDAVVDLQEKQVTVTGVAAVDALKKAITDAGYEVLE